MTPDSARRALLAAACVTAPVFGLVAALATPSLATGPADEVHAVAASPNAFYVYALCILLSSLLLVPAVFALLALVRPLRPWAALVTGVVAQVGMLVAIGDAASELVFWQMAAHGHNSSAMVTVIESFDHAPGASLIYTIGGLCTLTGVLALGILLWRTHTLPLWAAACLPLGAIANIAGFSAGNRPLLAGSYVILALNLVPTAIAVRKPSDQPTSPTPARAHPTSAGTALTRTVGRDASSQR